MYELSAANECYCIDEAAMSMASDVIPLINQSHFLIAVALLWIME
jgi:hypothetical protein